MPAVPPAAGLSGRRCQHVPVAAPPGESQSSFDVPWKIYRRVGQAADPARRTINKSHHEAHGQCSCRAPPRRPLCVGAVPPTLILPV
ncbi:hypothetical protein E2C01_049473 [Portunus trituberculatus]|uniref:Uncharacterized protein n=1 Tax=Portunus trituberculatus TaxID=210409 RepID=A0A5B7GE18_PORTR|nr:hypothetical protein [Portunus trituberculatus]